MMRMVFFLVYLLLPASQVTACGKGSDTQRTASSTVAANTSTPTSLLPKDTVPGAGRLQWTLADVEETLNRIGVKPVRLGSVKQPFLGPVGTVYRVSTGELQVYIYGDAGAVGRDTDKLDTANVAPPTMKISWIMLPSLITENNLALILLTRDAHLRRQITEAIRAKASLHGGEP
jgi:hypothetical protein